MSVLGWILMSLCMLIMAIMMVYGAISEYEIRKSYGGKPGRAAAFVSVFGVMAPQMAIVALCSKDDLSLFERFRGLWMAAIFLAIGFFCVKAAYKNRPSGTSIAKFIIDMAAVGLGVGVKVFLWVCTFCQVHKLLPKEIT